MITMTRRIVVLQQHRIFEDSSWWKRPRGAWASSAFRCADQGISTSGRRCYRPEIPTKHSTGWPRCASRGRTKRRRYLLSKLGTLRTWECFSPNWFKVLAGWQLALLRVQDAFRLQFGGGGGSWSPCSVVSVYALDCGLCLGLRPVVGGCRVIDWEEGDDHPQVAPVNNR